MRDNSIPIDQYLDTLRIQGITPQKQVEEIKQAIAEKLDWFEEPNFYKWLTKWYDKLELEKDYERINDLLLIGSEIWMHYMKVYKHKKVHLDWNVEISFLRWLLTENDVIYTRILQFDDFKILYRKINSGKIRYIDSVASDAT